MLTHINVYMLVRAVLCPDAAEAAAAAGTPVADTAATL
jgi:hypothetical protein